MIKKSKIKNKKIKTNTKKNKIKRNKKLNKNIGKRLIRIY